MFSCSLKCKEIKDSKNTKFVKKISERWWLYQTVWFEAVKNKYLSKSEKLLDY